MPRGSGALRERRREVAAARGDVEDTRAFLKTIDANWFRINVATPLVGSEMYETALAKNYLVGDILKAGYKA